MDSMFVVVRTLPDGRQETAGRLTRPLGSEDVERAYAARVAEARNIGAPAGVSYAARQAEPVDLAEAIIVAATEVAAAAIVARVSGASLGAVARLLEVSVSGTVAQRRAQLVRYTHGRILDSLAVRFAGSGQDRERAAELAAWRVARVARARELAGV